MLLLLPNVQIILLLYTVHNELYTYNTFYIYKTCCIYLHMKITLSLKIQFVFLLPWYSFTQLFPLKSCSICCQCLPTVSQLFLNGFTCQLPLCFLWGQGGIHIIFCTLHDTKSIMVMYLVLIFIILHTDFHSI